MRKSPSLKRLFLTGLLTLLPIWLTWVVVKFVFVLLSDISRPLIGPMLATIAAGNPMSFGWLVEPWVQTTLALVATLAVILLSGVMARVGSAPSSSAWMFTPRRKIERPLRRMSCPRTATARKPMRSFHTSSPASTRTS